MGCTSSAPTVATPDANTVSEQTVNIAQKLQEKDTNNQEKISKEDQNETNDSNVLPKCDTISEPIQIFRNNKSLTDLRSLDNVRENNDMENDDGNNKDNTPMDPLLDDKMSSLENIVKRVIEIKVTDNIMNNGGNSQNEDENNHNIEQKSHDHGSDITLQINDIVLTNNEDVKKNVNCEEKASPTQSEGSRVTRWEALADIAAELPPSLAVDPITGQIYALSK